jgi:hypothetical protein
MKITDNEADTWKIAQRILPEGACEADVDLLAQRLDLAAHRREIPRVRKAVTVARINPFDGNPYQATEYHAGLILAGCAEFAARNGHTIRPELAAVLAPPPSPPPTPTTTPPLPSTPEPQNMRLAKEAAAKFYANVDESDPSTYPTNETVVAWLKLKGLSNRLAQSVATLIRPENAPKGRPQSKW